jgi:hypothetical protein
MMAVMCVTEELQVTAQLVGVMPRGHPSVLSTTPLVRLGILLDTNPKSYLIISDIKRLLPTSGSLLQTT